MLIRKEDAEEFEQPGVKGRKYDNPELIPQNSFVYGELDGEHGERVSTDVPRLYYVLDGEGRFEVDGQSEEVKAGDLIIIPPNVKHNYWSKNGVLKFILYMERH